MSATTIGQPPTTSDQVGEQVVVDLLQAGAKLTTDEIGLLNTIANPPTPEGGGTTVSDIRITKDLDKASTTLFQLNDTLNKLGDAVIKGQLTDHKLAAAEQKIEYLKIKLEDIIISSLNVSQEQAEAIVQPIIDDAEAMKLQLADLNTASQLVARKAGKGQQEFLRIDANVMKLEDLAIKIKVDGLEGKPANPGLTEQVSLNFSKIEVEYKAQKLDQDETAVSALDNFQATLFPELSGGGNFDGGVTIAPPNKTAG
jgi:type VI protein secretion system component Hcp